MADVVKSRVAGPSAWAEAARLLARWLATRERVDRLMEAAAPGLDGAERARLQHLVFGVVRHALRLETALQRVVAHPPRFVTRAVLFVAGFELIEQTGETAKIVHHAVEQAKSLASPAEARLVNAVARKLAETLRNQAEPPAYSPAEALAEFYSHPAWLVRRWLALFGAESTRALLAWNQRPAPVFARWRPSGTPSAPVPDWLKATPWPGFFEVPSGRWADVGPLLQSGRVYLQDPAARIPIELLAPKPGEAALDACAAPGGKSLQIADSMAETRQIPPTDEIGETAAGGGGLVVSVDLPGGRIDRLRENLSLARGVRTEIVTGDLRRELIRSLGERGLPREYPAVLADVPCSNTGVMRHRIDVKWRLQEGDFRKHARQQLEILAAAARLVAPGGRLVYSTCSIDPEENIKVVEAFLKKAPGKFELVTAREFFPWVNGHDGGGAYLLRRQS
jgi:16S rRNA (cytosine967-C5)-methyltransferase